MAMSMIWSDPYIDSARCRIYSIDMSSYGQLSYVCMYWHGHIQRCRQFMLTFLLSWICNSVCKLKWHYLIMFIGNKGPDWSDLCESRPLWQRIKDWFTRAQVIAQFVRQNFVEVECMNFNPVNSNSIRGQLYDPKFSRFSPIICKKNSSWSFISA
jgi:hypothetical protein